MIGALRDPLIEAELTQLALFRDRPAVFGRGNHPLAGTNPGPAELAQYPWTVPAKGAPLRDSFERYFTDAGVEMPQVPIESGSVMMIRQILIDSDYLTLLSSDQLSVEIEAGWLVKLAELPAGLGRTIGVTARAGWRPTAVQQEFLAELEAAAREVPN